MTETGRPDAIEFRDHAVLRAVLGYVIEAHPDKPAWPELIDYLTIDGGLTTKTAENVLYDLAKFGALQRHGRPANRGNPDTRALSITTLGRHWFDQTTPPQLRTDRKDQDR